MIKPNVFKSKYRAKLKQYFFRLKFKKIENWRFFLKILIRNRGISNQTRVLSIFYLISINKKSLKSKHKNVCMISSWTKGVHSFVKLNRLSFMDKGEKLYIPGLINSKW